MIVCFTRRRGVFRGEEEGNDRVMAKLLQIPGALIIAVGSLFFAWG
jgi:hypothetical protein